MSANQATVASTGPASLPGQQAPLGTLLAQAVAGVVEAQRVLDRDAQERVALYAETPQGEVALPPLWFTMREVRIELEVAASLSQRAVVSPAGGITTVAGLDARLLNPAAVSLFGYSAASGLKVSLVLEPR